MRTYVFNNTIARLFAPLIPQVTVIDVEHNASSLVVTAFAHATSASCSRCGIISSRVHSYYTRRLHDVPICGLPVRLVLHLRRFRCGDPSCPTHTFSERLPDLLAPFAQRTTRLNELLRGLALAFGGAAGARQSVRSAIPASGDTLLRRAHTAIPSTRPTPRVLGIDDFSFRKGQVFGTVLTDGESHEVIDLLPDRTTETVATWLQAHKGVEVVTRDRSAEYARAIALGAPHATQVADRFHLAKNAGEALERIVQRHHQGLRLAATAIDQARAQPTTTAVEAAAVVPLPPAPPPPPIPAPTAQRSPAQEHRYARYQEVVTLAAAGLGPKAIAHRVGLTRQTVAIWLRAGSFREHAPAPSAAEIAAHYPIRAVSADALADGGTE